MPTIIKAISNYLKKQSIKHEISTVTLHNTPQIIIEHSKNFSDFTTIYTNPNNTITIANWTKTKHTTIDLADPQLLPKILQILQQT